MIDSIESDQESVSPEQSLLLKLTKKGIPRDFLEKNQKHLYGIDPSKDGLEMFGDNAIKKLWIQYCLQDWGFGGRKKELISTYVNEALSAKIKVHRRRHYLPIIKGLSKDELADLQLDVNEQPHSFTIKDDEHIRKYTFDLITNLARKLYFHQQFGQIQELSNLIKEKNVHKELNLWILAALTFGKANFKHNLNLENVTEADYDSALNRLPYTSDWSSEVYDRLKFRRGAYLFSYKHMLEYIQREGLSLHDAVHAIEEISELFRISGLSANEFYNNVLKQVAMDNSSYPEGSAHHHFNAIAKTANKSIIEVVDKLLQYKEIDHLQKLAAIFESPQAALSTWTNIKRCSDLEQLLGQVKILENLKEEKLKGNDALYHYIETLAFHPDSKVNMQSILDFWMEPKTFLAAESSDTPHELHDRIKPSNYVDISNLDLTALELRNALIEGKMDQIQVFSPLKIKYKISLENYSTLELLFKALGSRKKNIEGIAKNPKRLFREIKAFLKSNSINIDDYLQKGGELPEETNMAQLESIIYDPDFGIEKTKIKSQEFVAQIYKKSDPEGAMAGDDTANCMPFGDGKNTLYTFNPNTAQFVIRLVKKDQKERTIAQSVITKDMDMGKVIANIISEFTSGRASLTNILPENLLEHAPTYIAADNVEVSPNFSNDRYQRMIEIIMRDFFKEYTKHYAQNQELEPNKIVIGKGYADALTSLPSIPNTFAPQAPISYSDKTGQAAYVLDLTKNEKSHLILEKDVAVPEVSDAKQVAFSNIPGVEYLTFEDALRVGYLEDKVYADNQSLMLFPHNMENALIAKDINNVAKDRPNLSLKYLDDKKQMRGYLLAWEGQITDQSIEYDAKKFYKKPCIYILDLVADKNATMAGGKLIKAFIELYKRNYLDLGKLIPIYTQARETTSYRIVQRQLERLGNEIGINFELIELPTYNVDYDTMHPIIIKPVAIHQS